MAQTNDTLRGAAILEQLATNPKTLALVERLVAGAATGVGKTAVAPKLAGVKTYIVAALGVLSTLLGVVDAFVQHGGLTPAGWFAAILALTGSAGLATLRSALTGHVGEIIGMLLDMGQSIALEVVKGQAPAAAAGAVVASTITAAPTVVAGAAAGAAAEVVTDLGGLVAGGLASILSGAAPAVAPPVDLHPQR